MSRRIITILIGVLLIGAILGFDARNQNLECTKVSYVKITIDADSNYNNDGENHKALGSKIFIQNFDTVIVKGNITEAEIEKYRYKNVAKYYRLCNRKFNEFKEKIRGMHRLNNRSFR